jgi:membrane protease YdiL (CAAX protease family)
MTPGESPGSSSFYRRPGIALLVALGGLVVAGILSVRWMGITAPASLRQLVDLVVLSASFVAATAIAIAVAASPGFTVRVLLRWRWTDLALGLGAGLVIRAVLELSAPTTGTLLAGFGGVTLADVAVLALGVAFVTPIVEELFFRGVVVAALHDVFAPLGRLIAGITAVVVSTAVFAGMHIVATGGVVTWGALLSPLVVGVGCGILFVLTGRIGAAIVAHVVSNAIGVALLLW